MLAGGPPCQGFSEAGKRWADDPRNQLFDDYLQLVEILRPRLVLVENVRGFQTDFGIGKPGVIENFAAALRARLSEQYMTASTVIRACDFGVPQVRPRFFLVGARKDIFAPGTVDDFFVALQAQRSSFLAARSLPHAPTARDAISDLELARNGSVPCPECEGFDEIAYGAARTSYQEVMRDGHVGAPSDLRLARHRPEIRERFASIIRASREDGRLNTTISSDVRKAHGLKKMLRCDG